MDSVQPDTDSDHHTHVDSDVHPASFRDARTASVKYSDAYAVI
jgi:hypothetical protein